MAALHGRRACRAGLEREDWHWGPGGAVFLREWPTSGCARVAERGGVVMCLQASPALPPCSKFSLLSLQ